MQRGIVELTSCERLSEPHMVPVSKSLAQAFFRSIQASCLGLTNSPARTGKCLCPACTDRSMKCEAGPRPGIHLLCTSNKNQTPLTASKVAGSGSFTRNCFTCDLPQQQLGTREGGDLTPDLMNVRPDEREPTK